MKLRVMLITRNLPPLLGGMERLNLHLARALADWGELSVIGPSGCRAHLPSDIEVIEIPPRPLPLFLMRALWAAWRQARKRPAIVIAGSGLTAPLALLAAWRAGAKALAYVHGLDLVTRHPVYRALWLPALRRLDHAFANSASTADIAARAGVARRRLTILHPGVSMPASADEQCDDFSQKHGFGQRPILLSVGRMTARKGLIEFVRFALPAIHARYPQVLLVIIGNEAPDALSGRGEGSVKRVLAAAAELGLRENIRVLGTCDDATLSQAYFAADAHVFPVRDVPGDIEGFGMVAMEAAAHGLPTVAFAVGGIPDAVSPGRSGYLVKPGDYEVFARQTCAVLALARNTPSRSAARAFAEGFRWERFGERLQVALSEILDPMRTELCTPSGHALLDLRSREFKAKKIESLLSLRPAVFPLRVLEIGTGSGGIAHYFGTHPTLTCEVDAVDVTDKRQIRDGYRFTKVDGVQLPFEDTCFDIVISNHVIEHVGDETAQSQHLREIHRVLKPNGIGYLAVPNRWMLVEPHYQLPFLSWLPQQVADAYVRFAGKGRYYDCRPLTTRQLEPSLRAAGFTFEQMHGKALRLTYELEQPSASLYRLLLKPLPDAVYAALRRIFPTLIYTLTPTARFR
jgi:phosphatidylinositol alpha-1,6-mannosyltransferase